MLELWLRLWATRAGRFVCSALGHSFGGWEAAGARSAHFLPTAYCDRCTVEL